MIQNLRACHAILMYSMNKKQSKHFLHFQHLPLPLFNKSATSDILVGEGPPTFPSPSPSLDFICFAEDLPPSALLFRFG